MAETVIPLSKRPLDWVILVFFFFNITIVTYIVDIEQLIIADPTNFEYPLWPPPFCVDIIHWYSRTFDPVLLARPVWWKVTIWWDALFFWTLLYLCNLCLYKRQELDLLPFNYLLFCDFHDRFSHSFGRGLGSYSCKEPSFRFGTQWTLGHFSFDHFMENDFCWRKAVFTYHQNQETIRILSILIKFVPYSSISVIYLPLELLSLLLLWLIFQFSFFLYFDGDYEGGFPSIHSRTAFLLCTSTVFGHSFNICS